MTGLFLTLGLLAYLFLLIDWKEMRSLMAQGGWVSAALYIGLTVLIVLVLIKSPESAAHVPVHHG